MSRRHIFTERQRAALFDLPTDELSLLKFYTLGDDDWKTLGSAADRKTGLALPCTFCTIYDIRACWLSDEIPREVLSFVGAQLGVPADALLTYATRRQTRQQHMDTLREIYGYKTFTGRGARDLRSGLSAAEAEDARSNEDLAHRFIVRCRETSTILPAVSTIERLCADALVAAERRIETRIAENLTADVRDHWTNF
ncbi:DUF4158 domain-containing protein [Klebsiella pneumoniae]